QLEARQMLTADSGFGLVGGAMPASDSLADNAGVYGPLFAMGDQDSGDGEELSAAGVTLMLEPTNSVAWYGESAVYTVRVTNTGDGEDTFNLAVLGLPLGFDEQFSQSTVTVDGGDQFVDVQL